MGGGREGDHPPIGRECNERVCTTSAKREAEDRGRPAAGALFARAPFPARGAAPLSN